MNDTEIRNELRRELDGAPTWNLSPDEVLTRAARRNRRHAAATVVTVVAALGVTAASLALLSSGGGGGNGTGPADSGLAVTVPPTTAPATTAPLKTVAPQEPAAAAKFVCDENGILPAELTVAAGSGGVSVSVDAAGRDVVFRLGDAGGNPPADRGPMEYPGGGDYWPLAPGDYQASCEKSGASGPVPAATLHVVDPGGYYVDATFGCESYFGSFADFVPNGSSLEQAVHDALDPYAKNGDVIRQVGYPDAALPLYALDRDGKLLVIATMRDMGKRGWIPDQVNGCSGVNPGDVTFHPPIELS